MMEPSEKSFHTPTSAVATKRTAVVGRCPAHSAMRSDHLNAVARLSSFLIEYSGGISRGIYL
jgi:hypothetical protein